MATKIGATAAKAHFAECLRAAEKGDSVEITRHGKTVAVIVPPHALARLHGGEDAGPKAGLASLAGGWEGSEELVRILERIKRTRAKQRPAPKFG